MLAFLGEKQTVKTTAVARYYGFERRARFSTEGSFGWADKQGPKAIQTKHFSSFDDNVFAGPMSSM